MPRGLAEWAAAQWFTVRRLVRTHLSARKPPPPVTQQEAVLKYQVRSQLRDQGRWLDAELELLRHGDGKGQ